MSKNIYILVVLIVITGILVLSALTVLAKTNGGSFYRPLFAAWVAWIFAGALLITTRKPKN